MAELGEDGGVRKLDGGDESIVEDQGEEPDDSLCEGVA